MIFDIRRAKNGYILKIINGKGNSGEEEKEIVYQDKYDDEVAKYS